MKEKLIVPKTSIQEQIKKLVELQTIDAEIYSLERELSEKPLYIEKLKQEFEGKKTALKALEDTLKQKQVQRKSQETELKAKEDEIAKANVQLSQIKTNKEYQAKITEMENIKADMSRMEEAILLAFDEIDAVSGEIKKEKEVVANEEKKYMAEKQKTDDEIKKIKDRVAVLRSQRTRITPEIDKLHLERYEKILQHREGLAIVPVVGTSCGGCYMNVPAQVINQIKMHEDIQCCEICTRILYLPDDL